MSRVYKPQVVRGGIIASPRIIRLQFGVLALLLFLGATVTPIGAQTNIQYSSHYSEGQRRQAREWAQTQEHYRSVAPRRSSSSSYSSFSSPYPDYRAIRERERKERQDYLRYQQREREEQESQKIRLQWLRDQPRLQRERAERERAAQRERAEQREREARERQARVEWKKQVVAAKGLLPLDPPPVFTNDTAKFAWYRKQIERGDDEYVRDPYASLIAAQMAFDGTGTTRDDLQAFLWVRYAEDSWNLKYALLGEMLVEGRGPRQSIASMAQGILYLQVAADRDDNATGGRERAFRALRRYFAAGQVNGVSVPENLPWRLRTLAWATKNNEPKAQAELAEVLKAEAQKLPEALPALLAMEVGNTRGVLLEDFLAAAAPLRETATPYTQYCMGRGLELSNRSDCVQWYLPVMKRLDGDDPDDDAICARLHRLAMLAGDEVGAQLDPRVFDRGKRWATITELMQHMKQDAEGAADDRESLLREAQQSAVPLDEMRVLCDWYSGACGVKADARRALRWANLLLAKGNTDGLYRAALCFRSGVAGWPRDDQKAAACFNAVLQNAPEKTDDNRRDKARLTTEIARMWEANPKTGTVRNVAEQYKYLEAAARLDPGDGGMALAVFLRDEPAYRNWNRALELLEVVIKERRALADVAKTVSPELGQAMEKQYREAVAVRDALMTRRQQEATKKP